MSWRRKQQELAMERGKSRNRVFCPFCGKNKFLFEEKNKALNFIKYNADVIESENGYKPIRAYYCSCCGGWHVTSQLKKFDGMSGKEFYLEKLHAYFSHNNMYTSNNASPKARINNNVK